MSNYSTTPWINNLINRVIADHTVRLTPAEAECLSWGCGFWTAAEVVYARRGIHIFMRDNDPSHIYAEFARMRA